MNTDLNVNIPVAAGCVLAGGRSRRMGTDKALLEFDGKTLLAIALERFSGFPEILISAADTERYAFSAAKIIPDALSGMGPIGGLISVLSAAESDLVCFRPVDAPLAPTGLHLILAEACAGKDAAVPVFHDAKEPLFACLSKNALPVFEALASGGNFKVADAFPALDTVYVSLEAPELLDKLGDPMAYLMNANDPLTFTKLGKRL